MTQPARTHETQLAVIGTGLAGFAAAIRARSRGLDTVQIGNTGALAYTTGYFDLLGAETGQLIDDPWAGLAEIRRQASDHPLARISDADIEAAFREVLGVLSEAGLAYTDPGQRNLMALLPGGSRKPTLCVPRTMLGGIDAVSDGRRGLIVDFIGLQGFSAREFTVNATGFWPGLRGETAAFPDMDSGAQVYVEVMARAMEVPETRRRLATEIKAMLGDAACVGMPAILGVHGSLGIQQDMQQLIGVPVFEIPTMPPAVPGIRLRETLETSLPGEGMKLVSQHKATRLECRPGGLSIFFQDNFGEVEIRAEAAILATGRFLSGGLDANRDEIRETLVGIPVQQPEVRGEWFRPDYLDNAGHPINRAGIIVDEAMRPLGPDRKPVNERMFAAGIILAGHDWVRQRCGAGVAFASAMKAVEAASQLCFPPWHVR